MNSFWQCPRILCRPALSSIIHLSCFFLRSRPAPVQQVCTYRSLHIHCCLKHILHCMSSKSVKSESTEFYINRLKDLKSGKHDTIVNYSSIKFLYLHIGLCANTFKTAVFFLICTSLFYHVVWEECTGIIRHQTYIPTCYLEHLTF